MALNVYKSSAGSGKTFTLVREYLKILLHDPAEYRHILAITFTNKATEEMKSRIILALSQLARQDPKAKHLTQQLIADPSLNLTATKLQQQAQTALSNILHNYADFSVKTIDSFFQQILRNFAKELKIPIHFEIEMDTNFVLEYLIAELMLDVGKRPEITQWLEDFAYSNIETDKSWKLEKYIHDLSKEMFSEKVWDRIVKHSPSIEENAEETADESTTITHATEQHYQLLRQVADQLWELRRQFEQTMRRYGKEALELIRGYGLKISDFKLGTANYFKQLASGEIADYSDKSTLVKIIQGNTAEWCAKTSPVKNKIEQLVDNGLQQILEDVIAYYNNYNTAYWSAKEVLKNIYVYGLLFEMKEKLKDFRTNNNKMLISDTTHIIRRIIGGNAVDGMTENEVPFVFEKVGLTYKHILLDEFQDTSDYQWKNILPLIKNALSEDHQALVVGDVKQSIYRWRGGNMHLLLSQIEDDLQLFYTPDTTQNLSHNYRSRTNIVQFNNDFFKAALSVLHTLQPQNSILPLAYKDVTQQIQRKEGGFVKIAFLEGKKKSEWKDEAKELTVATIQELREKGIRFNQIALLTRDNKEGVELAELLAQNDIKVISSISLLLNQSYKILLLVACLRYLIDERNHIARTEILLLYRQYAQQYGTNEEKQQWEAVSLHQIYSDHLAPKGDECLFNTLLSASFINHIDQFARLSLYETVEHLIFTLHLDIEPDIYIQRFQDLVLDQHHNQSTGIKEFLNWWDKNQNTDKCSIIVPKGEDAVTVMTIHKAKGLEFPVVIMPFCDWPLTPNIRTNLWTNTNVAPFDQLGTIPVTAQEQVKLTYFAPEYEREVVETIIDNMNLMYVAFTRPTDELYLFTPAYKKSKNPINTISKLLYLSLQSGEFEDIASYDTESNTYTRGVSVPELIGEVETDDVGILQRYICEDYSQRITIKSDLRQHDIVLNSTADKLHNLDKILLEILEKTQYQYQIEASIQRLYAQGAIKKHQIPLIKQHIDQLFQLPEVQQWYSKEWDKILAERAILNHSRKRVPTRLLFKGKKVVVVDYKIGEPDPDHHHQLNDYADLLTQMGYEVTQKYLLYLDLQQPKIISVT
jgi:ATP-dependent exoDNAse (exonuclease V) beta subunit